MKEMFSLDTIMAAARIMQDSWASRANYTAPHLGSEDQQRYYRYAKLTVHRKSRVSVERRFNISRPSTVTDSRPLFFFFAKNKIASRLFDEIARRSVRKIVTFDRECNSGCTCWNEAPRHAKFQMIVIVVIIVIVAATVSIRLGGEFGLPQECPVYSRVFLSLSLLLSVCLSSSERTPRQTTSIYKGSLHRFL